MNTALRSQFKNTSCCEIARKDFSALTLSRVLSSLLGCFRSRSVGRLDKSLLTISRNGVLFKLTSRLFCLLIIFLIVGFSSASAQSVEESLTPEQRAIFEEVEGNVLSPFCPGRLLKDCPSSAARDYKFKLKRRILDGESADQIMQSVLEEFGEEVRAAPKHSGVGLLAWYLPIFFLLIGFVVILFWLKGQIKGED